MTTNNDRSNNWHNIAGELPAPRDDEPQHLRDDIVAELQDHLACAMNRELHAVRDEAQARVNVIEKFGNPASIACKLWWDAMKERIMSQRILIGTVVLLAIACLAASGFAWMAVQDGREVNEIVMANSQSMMETNRAMVEKLSELAATATDRVKDTSSDVKNWTPLKIKLVKDKPDGPPAEGYRIRLAGKFVCTDAEAKIIEKTSDANGIMDFGEVCPGAYVGTVSTPWNESYLMRFGVAPNKPHTETVICPGEDVPDVDVQVSVNWPDDLRDLKLGLVCQVTQNERNHSPDESENEGQWHFDNVPNRLPTGDRSGGSLWIDEQAKIAQLKFNTGHSTVPFHKPNSPRIEYLVGVTSRESGGPGTDDYIFAETLQFRALPVKIIEMEVVLPSVESIVEKTGLVHSLDPIYAHRPAPYLAYWPLARRRIYIPKQEQLSTAIDLDSNRNYKTLLIPESAILDKQSLEFQEFTPQPGEKNVWTVELPESLIARTREALTAIDNFKAKQASNAEATTENE